MLAERKSLAKFHFMTCLVVDGFTLHSIYIYYFICIIDPDDYNPGPNAQVLDWDIRYRVAVGTAKGLLYLHEGCQRRMVA